jgi:hypothetical protein
MHSRLKVAIGPTIAVDGDARTLINGIDVDQVRLNPAGAKISLVTNGFKPCAAACGHHTRHQAKNA